MNLLYIKEFEETIKKYVSDININEIAEHIKNEDLSQWLNSWRRAFELDILNLLNKIEGGK